MKAKQFVERLEALAPTIENLQKVGLNEDEAIAERKTYYCSKRPNQLSLSGVNEVVALLTEWNVGQIEIGMVRLFDEPVQINEGLQVGLIEADPLVITSEGEMIAYEKNSQHILWQVAQSPDSFLDALVIATDFLTKTGMDIIDFEDVDAAKQAANDCAMAVGGNDYTQFYLMLLGGD
jgi:hypothetical protein